MANHSLKLMKAGAVLAGGAVLAILAVLYFQAKAESAKGAKRSFEIKYSVRVEDIPGDAKEIKVWVPVPLTSDCQKLHFIRFESDYPYEVVEERRYGNKYIVFDLSRAALSGQAEAELALVFGATRNENRPLVSPLEKPSPKEQELSRFLSANKLIPVDGKVAEEASRVAGGLEDKFEQSKALYDHIVDTLKYDRQGTGWGRGDAVYACDIRKGNCTDFHSLFIGEARSLGIPSRFVMGLPIPEERDKGTIDGYHCWAEFYIDGKGWLPVDASEANKKPEKREKFFGGVDENRLAFTIGRDIKLPGSAGEPVNYSIYPYVEIDGDYHDEVETLFSFKDRRITDSDKDKHTYSKNYY